MTGYTNDQVTRALTVLALHGGVVNKAKKVLLEEYQIRLSVETYKKWRDETHRTEYQHIRVERAREIEDETIKDVRDLMRQQAEVEMLAVAQTKEKLEAGKVYEPWKVVAEMARAKSSNIDKLLVLTGRPDRITEHRDIKEIERALEGMGVLVAVEEPRQLKQ